MASTETCWRLTFSFCLRTEVYPKQGAYLIFHYCLVSEWLRHVFAEENGISDVVQDKRPEKATPSEESLEDLTGNAQHGQTCPVDQPRGNG